jgi:hypothetical protein
VVFDDHCAGAIEECAAAVLGPPAAEKSPLAQRGDDQLSCCSIAVNTRLNDEEIAGREIEGGKALGSGGTPARRGR